MHRFIFLFVVLFVNLEHKKLTESLTLSRIRELQGSFRGWVAHYLNWSCVVFSVAKQMSCYIQLRYHSFFHILSTS